MRIAIAQFSHETCTFCPERTTIDSLEPYVQRGQEVIDENKGIPNYLNGFISVLENNETDIVPISSIGMAPGPYTSWFTPECFDKYSYEIAEGIKKQMPVDGVLLALHGAMAVEGVPKPEAEIVRRVRNVVGDNVPIMVTLDLHANEDHELTDAADAVFIIRTYPHIDTEETGKKAAKCMVDTLKGNVKPTQALRKPGVVSASIFQGSEYHPMKVLYDKCREYEKRDDVISVGIAPGFAYADVVDIGMSIVAVTNNNLQLANEIVDQLCEIAWDLRHDLNKNLPNTKEGIAEVIEIVKQGKGPVTIADGADRTGDSTHVLRELLEQGATNFAIPGMSDPKAIDYLFNNHEVGDIVTIKVGGWASEFSGDPVEISGEIIFMGSPEYKRVGPMGHGQKVKDGKIVTIDMGQDRYVVVSDRMRGANDSAPYTAANIDYTKLDIIPLKSRVHHRAYWDDIVNVDYKIDAPGIGAPNLLTLEYENVPKDAFPIGDKFKK
ncbi:MAG: M81 family metallopeptidase [Clostridia bacterium]